MRRTLTLAAVTLLAGLIVAACAPGPTGGGPGVPLPTCDREELVAPIMISPTNGANIEIPGLTFHWSYIPALCVPSTYQIEISQDPSFDPGSPYSGATIDYGQDSWSPEVGLLSATIYYWRIRAAVPEGVGPWSSPWMFYTGPVCGAGDLVAPQTLFPHGYMFVYDAPFFQWSYPAGGCLPDGYHVQVSSGADFSALLLDETLASPTTKWMPTLDWEDCSTFYWRVAARSGGIDGPPSVAQPFSVNVAGGCTQACTEDQLIAPIPLSPPHYSNVGTAPTVGLVPHLLQWGHPMPCLPQGFAVHLSTEPDFSDTSLFGGASPVTMPGGSWTPAVTLQPATQYWWEVAAGVGTTFGPFSPRRSFFTGPECATGSDAVPPTLLSPADGAVVDTLSPWLRYTPGAGGCVPDGYAIYLDTDPDFAGEPPYASFNFPGTTFIPDPLEDCTTYYWRVSPIQDEFVLPWSEVRSFRTQAGGLCPLSRLIGVARELAPCRFGPGPGWQILGYILAGERSEIYARDMSGRWFAIENPDNLGEMCWVPSAGIDPLGDVSDLRIYAAPVPTAVPPACSREMPKDQCEAVGGTWVQAATHAGYCQCP